MSTKTTTELKRGMLLLALGGADELNILATTELARRYYIQFIENAGIGDPETKKWEGTLLTGETVITGLIDLVDSNALEYQFVLGGVMQEPVEDFTIDHNAGTITVTGPPLLEDIDFFLIYRSASVPGVGDVSTLETESKEVVGAINENYVKIQESAVTLGVEGKPLVFAFDPKNRNIENLKHGIYVKNPLTNGDGTIGSEDVDSLAGVFNYVDGNFYCGEGYENSLKQGIARGITFSRIEEVGEWTYCEVTTGSSSGGNVIALGSSTQLIDPSWDNELCRFFIEIELLENNSGTTLGLNATNDGIPDLDLEIGSLKKYDEVFLNGPSANVEFFIRQLGFVDYSSNPIKFRYKKIMSCLSSSLVPFVKDAAHDGNVLIKEPWTDLTHTIINLDENLDEQQYFIDAAGINLHLQNDGITRNNFVSYNLNYEGLLTLDEKTAEIDKVKSGKLVIENTGVYEPVQGSKKRANEYGQTKNYVMLESQSTDIQLVETNKIVYTEDFTGTKRRDRISDLGVITGDGGIEDINGYIRLTAVTSPSASTQVEAVIKNVN